MKLFTLDNRLILRGAGSLGVAHKLAVAQAIRQLFAV
jgi:hypothetical protein